jgi:hypothetical protein
MSVDQQPVELPLGQRDAATIHRLAVDRVPFSAGKLTGQPGTVAWDRLARARSYLAQEGRDSGVRWVDHYRQVWGEVDYTVSSFDTPIAWLVDRYWVVVTHFLSQPTKRHQQIVRALVHLHVPARRAA